MLTDLDDGTMNNAAVKESRRVLRLVEAHLAQIHLNLGVRQESKGLVDVVYHPTNKLPHLNYVSPRKKTAWIPGPEIKNGLQYLRDLGRVPRVYYIEGLYPPLFARTLRELGLVVEREIPLMIYKADDAQDGVRYTLLSDMTLEYTDDQEGIAMWWYVWRNAYYDVLTGGTEPVYIGQDMREITLGRQVDVLVYRYGFPIGVVRLTTHDETANISAIAIMKEARSPQMIELFHRIALKTALERGCKMIFTAGDDEDTRQICRNVGFMDSGSLVCYAELPEKLQEENHATPMAEPVFVLR